MLIFWVHAMRLFLLIFHQTCLRHQSKFINRAETRPAQTDPFNEQVTYIVMTNEKLQARVQRAGIGTTYQAGLGSTYFHSYLHVWILTLRLCKGALVKVFMHELLPDVKRAIYFDTDMAFMVDPLLLWQEFDRLTADQMIALPTQVADPDAYHVCTCVM